jgi:hypothetical protein
MLIKLYRYRIQPEKKTEYLAIQKQADQIYRKYVPYRVVFLNRVDDPGAWVEIHWYPDEETYSRAMKYINHEEAIDGLWQEFQSLLAPDSGGIEEEIYHQEADFNSLSIPE